MLRITFFALVGLLFSTASADVSYASEGMPSAPKTHTRQDHVNFTKQKRAEAMAKLPAPRSEAEAAGRRAIEAIREQNDAEIEENLLRNTTTFSTDDLEEFQQALNQSMREMQTASLKNQAEVSAEISKRAPAWSCFMGGSGPTIPAGATDVVVSGGSYSSSSEESSVEETESFQVDGEDVPISHKSKQTAPAMTDVPKKTQPADLTTLDIHPLEKQAIRWGIPFIPRDIAEKYGYAP